MINVLVFEDARAFDLHPVATSRPAFAISCACSRLVDWLAALDANVVCDVREHLREIVSADFGFFSRQLNAVFPMTVVLNARIAPSQSNFSCLGSLLASTTSAEQDTASVLAVDQNNEAVAFAVPSSMLTESRDVLAKIISNLENDFDEDCKTKLDAFRYPHDVIDFNQKHFCENLEQIVNRSGLKEIRDGVFAHKTAKIDPNFVAKTNSGPVVFGENSKVGPFSFFEGPVFVGPNCTVLEHASIKDFVYLTNTVKAGGEIEASVIEPFSNKQHHGFLGHSYLGSWINIGAGTCNSDLKNTYGKVNATYGRNRIPTDLQFIGCFLGDYSKTAINTSIFTGKSIGVCSMMYGFVTTNVPSFVNYARTFGDMTGVPADIMVTTQRRMFGRRNVPQRPIDIQLINDMFDLTALEREQHSISFDTPKL